VPEKSPFSETRPMGATGAMNLPKSPLCGVRHTSASNEKIETSMSNGWPLSARIKTRLNRWRRRAVKRKNKTLFDDISALLFRLDPVGIKFEDNADEYDPEVGTIPPRLSHCHSFSEVRRVVFEEFSKWFGPETAGEEMRYNAIAEELWLLWSTYQRT
jgi:hypothetical protein